MKRLILIMAALGPVVLGGCSYDEWNNWNRECREMGGIIAETERGILSTRYECFVDGKEVNVPGY